MRRVAITGAGTINPLGHTVQDTMDAMARGSSAIGPLNLINSDRLSVKIGAAVKGYAPEEYFEPDQISLLDPISQFALVSAQQAMEQSGLADAVISPSKIGVIIGNSGGGMATQDENFRRVYEEGQDRVHPFVVPRLMSSAPAAHISMAHGLKGPSFCVSSACASANHAIILAMQMIRSGMLTAVLTGGTEAMLTFGGIKAWEGLRVLSATGCRPFSEDRDGMVQGEGAAVFVLEDYENAVARQAPILAEVLGGAMSSDAGHIVKPSRTDAAYVMKAALNDARVAENDVDYVNAHGTGTRLNDKAEAEAIYDVFGEKSPPVSSTKSQHGHLIGATSAVELIACLTALHRDTLPPTPNTAKAARNCPINLVTEPGMKARVTTTLSNAFAFGGMNASLVLGAA